MKWFYNMKVGKKLLASFIVVALIAAVVGFVGYRGIDQVGGVNLPSVAHLSQIEAELSQIVAYENSLLNPTITYEDRLAIYENIAESEQELEYHISEYERLPKTQAEQSAWDEIQTDLGNWDTGHSEFMALSRQLDDLGLENPQDVHTQIAMRQKDHVEWIWMLRESIENQRAFEGGLDAGACALGQWLDSYETRSEPFTALMQEIEEPHRLVHESGQAVNELITGSNENRQELAREIYNSTALPNMNSVLDILDQMDEVVYSSDVVFDQMVAISLENALNYDEAMEHIETVVDQTIDAANREVNVTEATILVFTLIAIVLAIVLGLFIASVIKKPVNKTLHMVEELGKGHLDTRLNMDTQDELGQMARVMDNFANALQNEVIGSMKKISEGDLNFKVEAKDEKDEIAPALQGTVNAINNISNDTNELIDAIKNGKLDARGDASKYDGSWYKLLSGVNDLVDAFAKPINVTAEYVERISIGDMPPQITEQYRGDFNEIKNNLNNLIKATQEVTEVASRLGVGDTNMILEKRSENDKMMESLQKVIENFKHDAENLELMARGNLDMDIQIMSDADVMAKSTVKLRDTLKTLMQDLDTLANAAVDGKLSTRADSSKHDGDFRKIVQGINKTLDAVIQPIEEAGDVLDSMSKNDFTRRVKGDYQGDHAKIKEALNRTLDSLNQVLSEINTASEQVASGSSQVSDSSQSLAQGATEQAGSIEELTATVSEIATQTKENANNAGQASELAGKARKDAEVGNDQMKEMLNSMSEINESSNSISKIIKVIDEIAFQTNILALNAAVEAARAGEHGLGFAVVAEEVRNLAARSAEAAKETTSLIEDSINKVEHGTKIANETAVALEGIVEGSFKVANLVGDISTASNEQATGISQVDKAIEQVGQVVQTNSATAQEGSAASEQLSAQADFLKSKVGMFKLMKDSLSSSAFGISDNIKSQLTEIYDEKPRHSQKGAGNQGGGFESEEFGKY